MTICMFSFEPYGCFIYSKILLPLLRLDFTNPFMSRSVQPLCFKVTSSLHFLGGPVEVSFYWRVETQKAGKPLITRQRSPVSVLLAKRGSETDSAQTRG